MVASVTAVAVLALTLAGFTLVGFAGSRADLDVERFLVARNSQSVSTLALSFLASGLGAWILFAPPEVGAAFGAVAIGGYAAGAALPFIVFGFLGPRLRAAAPQGLSLPEFARARFGRNFHVLIVLASTGYMLLFLTAELTAVGAVTAIMTGIDPRWVIVAVALVTTAYTGYGGLPASLRTDRWQAGAIVVLLALAAAATLVGSDDPAALGAALTVDAVGIEVAVTLVLAVTTANLLHQGYWQRVWSASDDATLRRGSLLGAALTIPMVVVVGGLGAVAAARGLDLGTPPVPFFALLADAGSVLGVLVLVLGVALVTSSVDTLQNGLASLVAAERRSASLGNARLVTVALMIPAVVVAAQGHSVLRLFLIADLVCAAVVVPTLLGLWPRASTRAAVAGAVAGLVAPVLVGGLTAGSLLEGARAATFPGAVPTLAPFVAALAASTVVALVPPLVAFARGQRRPVGGGPAGGRRS